MRCLHSSVRQGPGAPAGRGLPRLEHLDGLSRAPEWGDSIREKLRARLTEWHGFLGRATEVARQILRKVLVGRLVLTPDENARTYTGARARDV